MLFTVKKENIIEGLQKAAGIIPTRAGAAYLRSLWIKAEGEVLTIMATDANIEFTGTYPADVKEPGLVGVNGRNFVDLVRRLPAGELRIRLDDATGTVILEQGRRTYKLPANDPTWFQSLAPFSSEGAVVWSGDFFQEIIDRVFFCVSDDESSDAIACLYFKPVGEGHIEVCGLNGHQFALTRFTHDDLSARLPEDGVLIQRKYVGELRKWLGGDEIEVNLTDKRLFVRSGDGHETLSLPRAGYAYPDYSPFMTRLASPDVSLLKLSEFQNPLTGLNFQGTGKLSSPLGADLLRTGAVPDGKILAFDKNCALEMVRAGDVCVEYDKLIDRQLERASITTISGFAKICDDAANVLAI